VFAYLAELHDRKVQSGQLGKEAAVPTLPQIANSSSASAAAASTATVSAEASRPEGSIWAQGSAAGPSSGESSEPVTAEVVPSLGATAKKPSWVQREQQPAKGGMPATVELQPSKKKGKKTLKQKLGKAKAKLGIADGCSIM
jgi:hypothetical protein